jgi:death-on-curing protein
MSRYPTSVAVIRWHDWLIYQDGGSYGVRDFHLLESAVAAPKQVAAYGSRNPLVCAAHLACALARNHAFIDGNKRTAFAAMAVFLHRRSIRMRYSLEWVDIIEGAAMGVLSPEGVAEYLRVSVWL